jgi:uncharacterized membrane protein YdjX (TVP38/TMEM64 family)
MKNLMNNKYFRKIMIICFLIAFLIAVYFCLGVPMISFVNDHESLQAYVDERGLAGWAFFSLLVIIQTVSTCIPGTPFYLAAGFVLGGLKGALLCDLCATIGNTIAFWLGHKFGHKLLDALFPMDKLASVEQLIKEKNPILLHVLFMLFPLPKDTYAWIGYYSGENLITWILLTFICRFPHIFVYTFGGAMLLEKNYFVLICGSCFAVLVYFILMLYLKKKNISLRN